MYISSDSAANALRHGPIAEPSGRGSDRRPIRPARPSPRQHRSRRPWSRVFPGLSAFLLGLAALAAGPANAQTYLDTTMTVGDNGSKNTFWGYEDGSSLNANGYGSLAQKTFDLGSQTYTIETITLQPHFDAVYFETEPKLSDTNMDKLKITVKDKSYEGTAFSHRTLMVVTGRQRTTVSA